MAEEFYYDDEEEYYEPEYEEYEEEEYYEEPEYEEYYEEPEAEYYEEPEAEYYGGDGYEEQAEAEAYGQPSEAYDPYSLIWASAGAEEPEAEAVPTQEAFDPYSLIWAGDAPEDQRVFAAAQPGNEALPDDVAAEVVPFEVNHSSREAFMASFAPAAAQALAAKGLSAELAPILVAIPINEQGWQREAPGNNYYGIKGSNPLTGANTGPRMTWEEVNGQRVNQMDTFRAYDSPAESVKDFLQFLEDNPRYAPAMQIARETGDPQAFIRAVHRAGYATDSLWSDKIIRIASEVPEIAPAAAAVPNRAARARANEQIPLGHHDGDGHDHGIATPYTHQQVDTAGNHWTVAFDYDQPYANPFNPNIPRHRGVDLQLTGVDNGGKNMAYTAFRDGEVVHITRDPHGGIGIIVDTGDPDARYDRYFHNNAVTVKEGDTVFAGRTNLGLIGETGTEGFPHLHYEVSQGINGDPVGQTIDPRPYIGPPVRGTVPGTGSAVDLQAGGTPRTMTLDTPYTSGRRSQTSGILIHSTRGNGATPEAEFAGTISHFRNNTGQVSANAVIAADGTVALVQDWDAITHHAGEHNRDMYGIEMVQARPGDPYTDAQYQSLAWLMGQVSDRYGLPLDRAHVVGHEEVAQGRRVGKSDPGPEFSFERALAMANQRTYAAPTAAAAAAPGRRQVSADADVRTAGPPQQQQLPAQTQAALSQWQNWRRSRGESETDLPEFRAHLARLGAPDPWAAQDQGRVAAEQSNAESRQRFLAQLPEPTQQAYVEWEGFRRSRGEDPTSIPEFRAHLDRLGAPNPWTQQEQERARIEAHNARVREQNAAIAARPQPVVAAPGVAPPGGGGQVYTVGGRRVSEGEYRAAEARNAELDRQDAAAERMNAHYQQQHAAAQREQTVLQTWNQQSAAWANDPTGQLPHPGPRPDTSNLDWVQNQAAFGQDQAPREGAAGQKAELASWTERLTTEPDQGPREATQAQNRQTAQNLELAAPPLPELVAPPALAERPPGWLGAPTGPERGPAPAEIVAERQARERGWTPPEPPPAPTGTYQEQVRAGSAGAGLRAAWDWMTAPEETPTGTYQEQVRAASGGGELAEVARPLTDAYATLSTPEGRDRWATETGERGQAGVTSSISAAANFAGAALERMTEADPVAPGSYREQVRAGSAAPLTQPIQQALNNQSQWIQESAEEWRAASEERQRVYQEAGYDIVRPPDRPLDLTDPLHLASMTVENIPILAAGALTATAVALTAGMAGAPVAAAALAGSTASAALMFGVEGGQAYQEAIDQGVDRDTALQVGAVVGTVNAALEEFGPLKWVPDSVKKPMMRGIVGQLASGPAVRWIARGLEGGTEEGAEEVAQGLVSNIAEAAFDPTKNIGEGLLEGAVGGFLPGAALGSTGQAARDASRIAERARFQAQARTAAAEMLSSIQTTLEADALPRWVPANGSTAAQQLAKDGLEITSAAPDWSAFWVRQVTPDEQLGREYTLHVGPDGTVTHENGLADLRGGPGVIDIKADADLAVARTDAALAHLEERGAITDVTRNGAMGSFQETVAKSLADVEQGAPPLPPRVSYAPASVAGSGTTEGVDETSPARFIKPTSYGVVGQVAGTRLTMRAADNLSMARAQAVMNEEGTRVIGTALAETVDALDRFAQNLGLRPREAELRRLALVVFGGGLSAENDGHPGRNAAGVNVTSGGINFDPGSIISDAYGVAAARGIRLSDPQFADILTDQIVMSAAHEPAHDLYKGHDEEDFDPAAAMFGRAVMGQREALRPTIRALHQNGGVHSLLEQWGLSLTENALNPEWRRHGRRYVDEVRAERAAGRAPDRGGLRVLGADGRESGAGERPAVGGVLPEGGRDAGVLGGRDQAARAGAAPGVPADAGVAPDVAEARAAYAAQQADPGFQRSMLDRADTLIATEGAVDRLGTRPTVALGQARMAANEAMEQLGRLLPSLSPASMELLQARIRTGGLAAPVARRMISEEVARRRRAPSAMEAQEPPAIIRPDERIQPAVGGAMMQQAEAIRQGRPIDELRPSEVPESDWGKAVLDFWLERTGGAKSRMNAALRQMWHNVKHLTPTSQTVSSALPSGRGVYIDAEVAPDPVTHMTLQEEVDTVAANPFIIELDEVSGRMFREMEAAIASGPGTSPASYGGVYLTPNWQAARVHGTVGRVVPIDHPPGQVFTSPEVLFRVAQRGWEQLNGSLVVSDAGLEYAARHYAGVLAHEAAHSLDAVGAPVRDKFTGEVVHLHDAHGPAHSRLLERIYVDIAGAYEPEIAEILKRARDNGTLEQMLPDLVPSHGNWDAQPMKDGGWPEVGLRVDYSNGQLTPVPLQQATRAGYNRRPSVALDEQTFDIDRRGTGRGRAAASRVGVLPGGLAAGDALVRTDPTQIAGSAPSAMVGRAPAALLPIRVRTDYDQDFLEALANSAGRAGPREGQPPRYEPGVGLVFPDVMRSGNKVDVDRRAPRGVVYYTMWEGYRPGYEGALAERGVGVTGTRPGAGVTIRGEHVMRNPLVYRGGVLLSDHVNQLLDVLGEERSLGETVIEMIQSELASESPSVENVESLMRDLGWGDPTQAPLLLKAAGGKTGWNQGGLADLVITHMLGYEGRARGYDGVITWAGEGDPYAGFLQRQRSVITEGASFVEYTNPGPAVASRPVGVTQLEPGMVGRMPPEWLEYQRAIDSPDATTDAGQDRIDAALAALQAHPLGRSIQQYESRDGRLVYRSTSGVEDTGYRVESGRMVYQRPLREGYEAQDGRVVFVGGQGAPEGEPPPSVVAQSMTEDAYRDQYRKLRGDVQRLDRRRYNRRYGTGAEREAALAQAKAALSTLRKANPEFSGVPTPSAMAGQRPPNPDFPHGLYPDEMQTPEAREAMRTRQEPEEGWAAPGELTRMQYEQLPNREIYERAGWVLVDGGFIQPGLAAAAKVGEDAESDDRQVPDRAALTQRALEERWAVWRQILPNLRLPPGMQNLEMEAFLEARAAMLRGIVDGTTKPEVGVLGQLLALGSVKRSGRSYAKTLNALSATMGRDRAHELVLRALPDIYPQGPPSPQEKGILMRPEILWAMLAGDTTDPVMMGMLVAIARPEAFATPEARMQAAARGVNELYRRIGAKNEDWEPVLGVNARGESILPAIHGRGEDLQKILGLPRERTNPETGEVEILTPGRSWLSSAPYQWRALTEAAQAWVGAAEADSRYVEMRPQSEEMRQAIIERLIDAHLAGIGPVKTRFAASMTAFPNYATLDTRMLRDVFGLSPKFTIPTVEEYEFLSAKLREIGSDSRHLYGWQWLPWEYLTGEKTTYSALTGIYQRVNDYMVKAEARAAEQGVDLSDVLEEVSEEEQREQIRYRAAADVEGVEGVEARVGMAFRSAQRVEDAEGHEAIIQALEAGRVGVGTLKTAFPELFNLASDAGLTFVERPGVGLGGWYSSDEQKYYLDRNFNLSVTGPKPAVRWFAASLMKGLPDENEVLVIYRGPGALEQDHIGGMTITGMSQEDLSALTNVLSDKLGGWSAFPKVRKARQYTSPKPATGKRPPPDKSEIERVGKGGDVFDVEIVAGAVRAFGGTLQELNEQLAEIEAGLLESGYNRVARTEIARGEMEFLARADVDEVLRGGPAGAYVPGAAAAIQIGPSEEDDAAGIGGVGEAGGRGDGTAEAGGLLGDDLYRGDQGEEGAQDVTRPSAMAGQAPPEPGGVEWGRASMTRGGASEEEIVEDNRQEINQRYSGDMAEIVVKEIVQNSVDASREYPGAHTQVDIFTPERKVLAIDQGSGMPYTVVQNEFTRFKGTKKGSGASGGMGTAKTAILGRSEKIEVRTVAQLDDGSYEESIVFGTADDYLRPSAGLITAHGPLGWVDEAIRTGSLPPDSLTDPALTAPWDHATPEGEPGTGTRLMTQVEGGHTWTNPRGYGQGSPIERWLDGFLGSNRVTDQTVGFTLDGRPYTGFPLPEREQATRFMKTLDGPTWAMDIFVSNAVAERQGMRIKIQNNGLYQLDQYLDLPEVAMMPTAIHANIRSKVGAKERGYPWSPDRMNIVGGTKEALEDYIVSELYREVVARESSALEKALQGGIPIEGGPGRLFNVGSVEGELLDGLHELAERPYMPILNRGMQKLHDRLSSILDGRTWSFYGGATFKSSTFGGFGVADKWIGLNVGTGGLQTRYTTPYVLLYDPWAIVRYAVGSAHDRGMPLVARRRGAAAGAEPSRPKPKPLRVTRALADWDPNAEITLKWTVSEGPYQGTEETSKVRPQSFDFDIRYYGEQLEREQAKDNPSDWNLTWYRGLVGALKKGQAAYLTKLSDHLVVRAIYYSQNQELVDPLRPAVEPRPGDPETFYPTIHAASVESLASSMAWTEQDLTTETDPDHRARLEERLANNRRIHAFNAAIQDRIWQHRVALGEVPEVEIAGVQVRLDQQGVDNLAAQAESATENIRYYTENPPAGGSDLAAYYRKQAVALRAGLDRIEWVTGLQATDVSGEGRIRTSEAAAQQLAAEGAVPSPEVIDQLENYNLGVTQHEFGHNAVRPHGEDAFSRFNTEINAFASDRETEAIVAGMVAELVKSGGLNQMITDFPLYNRIKNAENVFEKIGVETTPRDVGAGEPTRPEPGPDTGGPARSDVPGGGRRGRYGRPVRLPAVGPGAGLQRDGDLRAGDFGVRDAEVLRGLHERGGAGAGAYQRALVQRSPTLRAVAAEATAVLQDRLEQALASDGVGEREEQVVQDHASYYTDALIALATNDAERMDDLGITYADAQRDRERAIELLQADGTDEGLTALYEAEAAWATLVPQITPDTPRPSAMAGMTPPGLAEPFYSRLTQVAAQLPDVIPSRAAVRTPGTSYPERITRPAAANPRRDLPPEKLARQGVIMDEAGNWVQPARTTEAREEPGATSGEHALELIREAGAKPDEIAWTGLETHLRGRGEAPVTREAILDYLTQRQIVIEETTLGGRGEVEVRIRYPSERNWELIEPDPAMVEEGYEDEEGEWVEPVFELPDSEDWDRRFTMRAVAEDGDELEYEVQGNHASGWMVRHSDGSVLTDEAGGDIHQTLMSVERNVEADAVEAIETAGRPADVKGPAKYGPDSDWPELTLPGPGREEYRELLLRLPAPATFRSTMLIETDMDRANQELREFMGGRTLAEIALDTEELRRYAELSMAHSALAAEYEQATQGPQSKVYREGHWDQPNVVLHVRFTVRTAADGTRMVVIEEQQSDWQQTGRERGFIPAEGLPKGYTIEWRPPSWLDPALPIETGDVVDDITQPRMLEPGTPEHAEYVRRESLPYVVPPEGRADGPFPDEATAIQTTRRRLERGGPEGPPVPEMPFQRTPTWVGLGLRRMIRWAAENGFERIGWTQGNVHDIRYPDPRRPKDAFSKFYDQMMVTVANDLGKPWGVEVTTARIPTEPQDAVGIEQLERGRWFVRLVDGSVMGGYPSEEAAQAAMAQGEGETIHALDIPPQMRRSALEEGQPMFMVGQPPPEPEGMLPLWDERDPEDEINPERWRELDEDAARYEIEDPTGMPRTDDPEDAAALVLPPETEAGPPAGVVAGVPTIGPPEDGEANLDQFPEWAQGMLALGEMVDPQNPPGPPSARDEIRALVLGGPQAGFLNGAEQNALVGAVLLQYQRLQRAARRRGPDGELSAFGAARLVDEARRYTALRSLATTERDGWPALAATWASGPVSQGEGGTLDEFFQRRQAAAAAGDEAAMADLQREAVRRLAQTIGDASPRMVGRRIRRGLRQNTERNDRQTVREYGQAMADALAQPGGSPSGAGALVAGDDLSIRPLEVLIGMRYNGMLIGARGILTDYATNTGMLFGKMMADPFLPESGGLNPLARGSIATAEYAALARAVPLMLRRMGQVLLTGVSDMEADVGGTPRTISGRLTQRIADASTDGASWYGRRKLGLRGGKLTTIGFVELAGRLKGMADVGIKTLASGMELTRQAAILAWRENKHPVGSQAWHERVGEIMNGKNLDPDPKRSQVMYEQMLRNAAREAERTVFQGEMGTVGRMMEPLQRHPLGQFVLPFLRTLYHIRGWAIDFSPLGAAVTTGDVIRGGVYRGLRRSEAGRAALGRTRNVGGLLGGPYAEAFRGADVGPAVADLDRRMLANMIGITGFFYLVGLAFEGILSGTGPPEDPIVWLDEDKPNFEAIGLRRAMEKEGWQRYSIKINGHWISYQNWGPLAYLMAAAAAIGEGYRYGVPADRRRPHSERSSFGPLAGVQGALDLWAHGDTDTFKGAGRRFFSLIKDVTFLGGLVELVEVVEKGAQLTGFRGGPSGETPGEKILRERRARASVNRWVADTLTTFMPLSAGTRAIAASQDPYARATDYGSISEQLALVVPELGGPLPSDLASPWSIANLLDDPLGSVTGRRQGLPILRDILGQPIKNQYQGWYAVTPFRATTEDLSSPVTRALIEAGMGPPTAHSELYYRPPSPETGKPGRAVLVAVPPVVRQQLAETMGQRIDQRLQQLLAEVPPERRAADPDAWNKQMSDAMWEIRRATGDEWVADPANKPMLDRLMTDPNRVRWFESKADKDIIRGGAAPAADAEEAPPTLAPPATGTPRPATTPTPQPATTPRPVAPTPRPGTTPTPRPGIAPTPRPVPTPGSDGKTQAERDRERSRGVPVPSR